MSTVLSVHPGLSKVPPLKPGVGQNIATRALPPARNNNLKVMEAQSACRSRCKGLLALERRHIQQRPQWPTVTLTWHASKHSVYKRCQRYSLKTGRPPVVYMPSISSTLGDTDVYRRKTAQFYLFILFTMLCVYTFSQITWLCPVWNKNWFCFTIPHSNPPPPLSLFPSVGMFLSPSSVLSRSILCNCLKI